MSDESEAIVIPADLSDNEMAVAAWLVTSTVPGRGGHKSADDIAKELGCDRGTVYRMAKRPSVVAAANELVNDALRGGVLPRIIKNILTEAETDAKLGLQVAKWLEEKGIDPLQPHGKARQRANPDPNAVTMTIPGGIDAAIRVMRREDGS